MKNGFINIILLFLLVILIPGCKKKNRPPHTPYTPSGPSFGLIDRKHYFSSLAIDPDGDSISMRFDWGNGDTSTWTSDKDRWYASEQTFSLSHSWSSFDTFYIRVQVHDKYENISEWSMPHSIVITPNHPPDVPLIFGPSSGYVQIPYQFFGLVIDPDGDKVALQFDWGDGYTSEWSALTSSGDSIWMTHDWLYSDTFYVKAQAKDSFGLTSAWSLPHSIILNELPAPSIPSGPSSGYIQTDYQFSSFEIHPDGYNVAIRFDWGDGDTSDWSAWVSSGNPCTMDHEWLYPDTYYIKAQAKDSLGATSSWSLPGSIEIKNATQAIVWICAIRSAAWSPREGHALVIFNNKMWMIGGFDGSRECNEVWNSPDGINWICVTDTAVIRAGDGTKAVVFDNKIWVIGGTEDGGRRNDVWCSSDGLNWTQVTDSARWSPRAEHSVGVFNNKIWVLGGNGSPTGNDVWYSTDGANWICATNSAEWSPRTEPPPVVFNNKIWIMGGETEYYGLNDVWYSSNGRDWLQTTDSAAWQKRNDHTAVVFDNKIWVLGGTVYGIGDSNDVWYSTDGVFWVSETSLTIFPKRSGHTAVVFDNKIWVIGGIDENNNSLKNDVWYRDIIYKK